MDAPNCLSLQKKTLCSPLKNDTRKFVKKEIRRSRIREKRCDELINRTKNRGKHRIEPSASASEFDKSCYSNFATSFEDEFPDLYNSVSRKPGNGAETNFHDINSTSTG